MRKGLGKFVSKRAAFFFFVCFWAVTVCIPGSAQEVTASITGKSPTQAALPLQE
jgi:hypothetical protein